MDSRRSSDFSDSDDAPLIAHPGHATRAFVLTGLAGSVAFVGILRDVQEGRSSKTDRLLLEAGHRLAVSPAGKWLTPLARRLSWFGNWQVLIPVGAALLYAAKRGEIAVRVPRFYILACAGSGGLALLTKHLVNRSRPHLFPPLEKAPFASFPSGHSLYSLVAYGFLAHGATRSKHLTPAAKVAASSSAVTIILLVGASRIYLGTHYPTDVMAGYLLGIPWLSALLAGEQHREDHDAETTG